MPETWLSNRKTYPSFSGGTPGTQLFSMGSALQKYYLIGKPPLGPLGSVGSAHLVIFVCAGSPRALKRGPAALSNAQGG